MSVGVAVPCFECLTALSRQEFIVRWKVLDFYLIADPSVKCRSSSCMLTS